jgi:hypothetical protein|tara:strand:+ start:25215 stop:25769 length:555 start_codon:yes stop_codon:yes gene_type:complete
MKIEWSVVATIAAPIIALFIGAALDSYLRKKSKLIAYFGHIADFRIKKVNTTAVYTHSLVIRNAGKLAANNVRLGHYAMPPDFHISPAIEHEVKNIPDSGQEILFPKLVPNEQITISYLYFVAIEAGRIHSYLKSDEGFAKVIPVITQQRFPKWVGNLTVILALVGIIALLYIFYSFISGIEKS